MGKQTIFENIKEWLAGRCWEWFLKLNNLTEDEYFRQIKEQESRTNKSRPVEKLVIPQEKQKLIKAMQARQTLYLLGFITEAEHEKIIARIKKFQGKYKINVTKGELEA